MMHVWLALGLLALTPIGAANPQDQIYPGPPWTPAADEVLAADLATFTRCDTLIQALATRMSAKVTDRRYTLSQTWGRVLRAKLQNELDGSSMSVRVTCWSKPGSGAQILVDARDDQP